jgi:hypothetical protein
MKMASAVIHLCVAKEINDRYLHKDQNMLLLGSIAPDISKQIGQTKEISHFLDPSQTDSVPDVDRFINKYSSQLDNPFELGYLIHLITDKYWFRDYVTAYIERYTKDRTKRKVTEEALHDLIYNDYTNLNIILIDKYNLPLDLFSNDIKYPESEITEIPINQLPVVVEKMGEIIVNSREEKTFMFDSKDIEVFIENTVKYIIKDLQMLDVKGDE